MSDYHREQLETLSAVLDHLRAMPPSAVGDLHDRIEDYLAFRREVDDFLEAHLSAVCTRSCFEDNQSACCTREGIITFFADVVINALVSPEEELMPLFEVLSRPNPGFKCVYLGPAGCLWRVKPIVCAMFLCDPAQAAAFHSAPDARRTWEALKGREKTFTWPDRPVLFDDLEARFLARGLQSPLMYNHNSPGLLRIKAQAGVASGYERRPRRRRPNYSKSAG
jgi:hypothetical protein